MRTLPTALVFLLLLTVPLLAASACSQPQERDTGNRVMPRTGPVASSSQVVMNSQEIRDKTGEYLALKLWADAARRTAERDPGNFHQVMFSEPDIGCVEEHRELMKTTPKPPTESLVNCAENSMAESRSADWNGSNLQERERMARRSLGFLFWSIDPPSLLSVAMAHDRGLNVSVRTSPEFARFAAEYDTCEDAAGNHAGKLAQAKTPERMAEIWLRSEEELRTCSNKVTRRLFD